MAPGSMAHIPHNSALSPARLVQHSECLLRPAGKHHLRQAGRGGASEYFGKADIRRKHLMSHKLTLQVRVHV